MAAFKSKLLNVTSTSYAALGHMNSYISISFELSPESPKKTTDEIGHVAWAGVRQTCFVESLKGEAIEVNLNFVDTIIGPHDVLQSSLLAFF